MWWRFYQNNGKLEMPKICYRKIRFHKPTLDIINLADDIIKEYQDYDML